MPRPTTNPDLDAEKEAFDKEVGVNTATPPTDGDLSLSLQIAQTNLQNADIEAAHRISDSNANRILSSAAPLTAFKVVQGMAGSVNSSIDMVEAFLPGIPTVGSEMKEAMTATRIDRPFLTTALKSGDRALLTGS